jgi:hypothetical protein
MELPQVGVHCDSGAVFAIAALYGTNFILFEYFLRSGAVGRFIPSRRKQEGFMLFLHGLQLCPEGGQLSPDCCDFLEQMIMLENKLLAGVI